MDNRHRIWYIFNTSSFDKEMSLTMKILLAYRDFFLVYILAAPLSMDWTAWLWYSLCIILAFSLRLGIEFNKNRLTWRNTLIQSIYTISWCFFSILVWNWKLKEQTWFEIYLFVNSLFAVFIVGESERVFEKGFRKWLGEKVGTVLATHKEEEKP